MDLGGSLNVVLMPDGPSKRRRSCGARSSSMVLGSVNLFHIRNRSLACDNGVAVGFVISDGKQVVG